MLWELWSFCSTPLGMLLWVHYVEKLGPPCGREPRCSPVRHMWRTISEQSWAARWLQGHEWPRPDWRTLLSARIMNKSTTYFKPASFEWYVMRNRKLRQGFWLLWRWMEPCDFEAPRAWLLLHWRASAYVFSVARLFSGTECEFFHGFC